MNAQIKVAVPSVAPGGLEAICSDHFGHCDCFTMITTDDTGASEVKIVPNQHGGGCGSVVSQLHDEGVDVVMVRGIGRRPLMGFQQAGIGVYQGTGMLVSDVIDSFRSNSALVVDEKVACQGGGGNHRHGRCGS